jgi:hypothetical protein
VKEPGPLQLARAAAVENDEPVVRLERDAPVVGQGLAGRESSSRKVPVERTTRISADAAVAKRPPA